MIKSAVLSLIVLFAQQTGPLDNPDEEARAQSLMREIRCVACENEPISQSASDIAGDMRERVRGLVAEGKSDAEVRAWFVERYGEFVLFRPDADGLSGKLLWGLPFLIFLGGTALLVSRKKTPSAVASVPPDHEDDTRA